MQRISISTHSITSSRPAAGRDSGFIGEHHLDRLLYIEAFAVSVREDRPHGGGGLLSAQKSPFSKAPNPIALTAKRGLLIC